MSLHNYIEKLRAKPVRERERIAVIWTAIGFALIFLIWIVSFKEMNKPTEVPVDQTSASLNDLKDNFQTGKDSIQDMMQEIPNQAVPGDNNLNTQNDNQAPADNTENVQDETSVPQLP